MNHPFSAAQVAELIRLLGPRYTVSATPAGGIVRYKGKRIRIEPRVEVPPCFDVAALAGAIRAMFGQGALPNGAEVLGAQVFGRSQPVGKA